MILLDENIPEDQCDLLRGWRFRFHQIGQDFGRQGIKDETQILPLLHKLDRATFFTRDLGFLDQNWCHPRYALVGLAVSQNEVARFIRRFLRHPSFNSKARRMGMVIRVSAADLRVWRRRGEPEEMVAWSS